VYDNGMYERFEIGVVSCC